MSRRLSDLSDSVALAAHEVVKKAGDRDLRFMVWSTWRPTIEQYALYVQGRRPLAEVNHYRALADLPPLGESDNSYTVTACDGLKTRSAHQSRDAFDLVVIDENGRPSWDYVKHADAYKALAAIARAHGFECGADWLTQPDGSPSPFAGVGLGWDPPHFQRRQS